MNRLLLLLMCMVWTVASIAQQVIVVEKGSVQSLLQAIEKANQMNESPEAEQLLILIPDGYYDLGDRAVYGYKKLK